jgi:23S rRNA (uracil1939-C5)-methyltransferase
VRRALVELGPPRVVYVSCDPETMARDLAHFQRLGYAAHTLTPVDMMPLTDQVETVALLLRSAAPAPLTLYRDDDVHIVELDAYDAPAPPSAGACLAGAAGLPGSGLAIWTRLPADQELWQASLRSARKLQLVLARGVTGPKGVLRSGSRFRRLAALHGHSLIITSSQKDVVRDLARIGHPVVGDLEHGHGPTNRHFEEKYALDRPFVHAQQVELHHPKSGARLLLAPALPGELAMVLARLGYVFTSNSPGE